ncbi:single-stranded-DNA-specific exonuclease RecJ [Endozoicomonas ascidiicola]|uniref:single-stranded-DNA-specific exonuclease RecJ n=1 Tax=Endozoicomonas ascidiicola TaxID=1698521 RepID=UPI00083140A9|nr:single-stranded-DNA-specific exonuclease RecJ [Endozoicomonas ascidiicola]
MPVNIIQRPYDLSSCEFSHAINPLLARIYSARGIRSDNELPKQLQQLHDYRQLKDIEPAAEILANAIIEKKRILIVGDFDCDGATSSALGVLAIRSLGGIADFLVPNRFEFGYGLTPEIVEAATVFKPDVLVTVDNGISSITGVQAAKDKGMQVVVTDHHLAGREIPNADAIVNPNQQDCTFPSKNTAGVGVIFYVMCAVRTHLRNKGYFEEHPQPNLAELLDLVALGTVADVVKLDGNNRILVFQGLARIRSGRCRPGITALIEVSGRNPNTLAASDLGFALGPRLNAAGRLDDMSIGIELLLCDDIERARELASELDGLNRDRKSIEGNMQTQAMAELEKLQLGQQSDLPWGVSLFQEGWHQGVVGILASRVKEKLNRPVIAFAEADNPEGEPEIKGSARSIPGLHMRDALDCVSREHPDLIIKFGGHAMAAGLTICKSDFDTFKQAFDREVRQQLTTADLQAEIHTDGELQPNQMTMDTAFTLREGGPWGQSFPEPSFNGDFQIIQQKLVGEKHLKMVLRLPGSETWLDAIAFNIDNRQWPNPNIQKIKMVYKLDINEFRGQQNLQLMVEHLAPATE